jgi:hypothetical protein
MPPNFMAERKIQINRAPVLTLWAAVVAERLGFSRDEAASLATVAGLTAQKISPIKSLNSACKIRRQEHANAVRFWIELLGRPRRP